MTRVTRFVFIAVACCTASALAQNAGDLLKNYTQKIGGDGLELNLVHMNARTVPVLFQPPTLYAMRAQANEFTMLYVQGTARQNVDLDTTNFTIEQDGETITSTATSIRNFTRGTVAVPRGERVDGVLTFAKRIDVSKPFVVRHGRDSAQFRFSAGQLDDIRSAAPQR